MAVILKEMADILQMTFEALFSWMNIWLKFPWCLYLFPRAQFTIIQHWLGNDFVQNRQQVIIWADVDLVHWHHMHLLGPSELMNTIIF